MDYELKQRFRTALQEQIASRISLAGTDDETVKALIRNTVEEATSLSPDISDTEREELVEDFVNEFLYFGPLQPLLADPGISEIMVNGGGIDKDGNWRPTRCGWSARVCSNAAPRSGSTARSTCGAS